MSWREISKGRLTMNKIPNIKIVNKFLRKPLKRKDSLMPTIAQKIRQPCARTAIKKVYPGYPNRLRVLIIKICLHFVISKWIKSYKLLNTITIKGQTKFKPFLEIDNWDD